jgi:hypothetical protein
LRENDSRRGQDRGDDQGSSTNGGGHISHSLAPALPINESYRWSFAGTLAGKSSVKRYESTGRFRG